MEQYFERAIDMAMAAPHMMVVSFAAAIIFLVGGFVLYRKREKIKALKGLRWPGVTCALLGCASLVTNVIQYVA